LWTMVFRNQDLNMLTVIIMPLLPGPLTGQS
jgi:hypothetical protein